MIEVSCIRIVLYLLLFGVINFLGGVFVLSRREFFMDALTINIILILIGFMGVITLIFYLFDIVINVTW